MNEFIDAYCSGLPLASRTPEEAASTILSLAPGNPRAVHLCNAYTIACAAKDPELQATLASAHSINLIDGWPVALIAAPVSDEEPRICRGTDLTRELLAETTDGTRLCFFGGTTETIELIRQRHFADRPGALLHSPSFGSDLSEEIAMFARDARNTGANIVMVGLGTPKQDFAVQRFAAIEGLTAVAIGAAFDFIAGTKVEAPKLVRSMKLEWLYRLIQEPRRLWRRYSFGSLQFAHSSIKQRRADRSRARSLGQERLNVWR